MKTRALITLAVVALVLLLACAARLAVGGMPASGEDLALVLELRGTRLLTGVIVGAALSVAGVLLQSLMRNPLASPDLLGLASGAGLGVMIAAYLAFLAGAGIAHAGVGGAGGTAAALVGSLAALAVVYALSQRRGFLEPVSLILMGVLISIICSAGIQFIRHLLPDQGVAAGRLLLGALRDDVSLTELAAVGGVVLAGIGVGVACGKAMDAAALGDDEARSVGVPLARLRVLLFIASGALAAAAVILAGPIGFVGLICPHLVRLGAGPSHRPLIIGSALAGAALVVGADVLVRWIELDAGRLPISVLTSLVGGPMLIWMLRREQP